MNSKYGWITNTNINFFTVLKIWIFAILIHSAWRIYSAGNIYTRKYDNNNLNRRCIYSLPKGFPPSDQFSSKHWENSLKEGNSKLYGYMYKRKRERMRKKKKRKRKREKEIYIYWISMYYINKKIYLWVGRLGVYSLPRGATLLLNVVISADDGFWIGHGLYQINIL